MKKSTIFLTVLALVVNTVGITVALRSAAAAPESETSSAPGALPSWFAGASADSADALPSWFGAERRSPASGELDAAADALPAWFATSSERPASSHHHTIRSNAVTVSGPTEINNCDVVTFTIVATNDVSPTTNAVITSTMPEGFEPPQRVFDVGDVDSNETITRHAVFSATCGAISGQNVVTVSQDGNEDFTILTDFAVNPGAITLRKEPSVIEAGLNETVTWMIDVENTGYGRVSNVVVTDTLEPGLSYLSSSPGTAYDSDTGVLTTTYISIPFGATRSFTIAAEVIACSELHNLVEAAWGCDGEACQTHYAKGSVDLLVEEPELDYDPPDVSVPYCEGSDTYSMTVENVGQGTAFTHH